MKTIIKIESEWNNAHCSIADAEEVLPGWAELPEATFATELALEADDRDGLMLDIATVMTAARLRITAMTAKPAGGGTTFVSLNFPVHDLKELEAVRGRLRGISGVKDVHRGNG